MIWRKGGSLFFFFLEGAHDGQLENLDLTLDWTGLDSGLDIFFRGVIFFLGGGLGRLYYFL